VFQFKVHQLVRTAFICRTLLAIFCPTNTGQGRRPKTCPCASRTARHSL